MAAYDGVAVLVYGCGPSKACHSDPAGAGEESLIVALASSIKYQRKDTKQRFDRTSDAPF